MKITRRDLLVALATLFTGGSLLALAQTAGQPVLHSTCFAWDKLTVTPTKVGARRAVCAAPTPNLAELEIHITTLNPGEEPHPPHQHPEEELMIIKEGTLAAQQGQTTNLVTAGGIIFEAANELHGLRNIGTNPATYYVIKIVPHDLAH